MKQINRHNEDGSYTYGYEAADGTFKIESKYPNGEVYGKYGFVDDQGKLREIEYGASRRGFEPTGQEVPVAPPTLTHNKDAIRALAPNEEDDGQYREDPSVYYKDNKYNNNQVQPSRYSQPQQYTIPQSKYTAPQSKYSQPQTYDYQEPAYERPQQTYRPQQSYQPRPQSYQPQTYQPQTYEPQTYQQPAYQPQHQQPAFRPQTTFNNFQSNYNPAQFSGHPATNIDINSGSYTVQYK